MDDAVQEDFARFTLADWHSAATEVRRALRNVLLQRGVFIKSGRGLPMAECLADFVISGYEKWLEEAERPRHNPKFCPIGIIRFNRPINT